MLKRCLLIAFILLTLTSGITRAQEGEPSDELSTEERGYLNRLAQAADRFENYTSFINEAQVIDNELTQLTIADQIVETQETRSLETTSTVTLGETPNGTALVNAYIDQYENGAYSGYAITGELRYVESTLFINISYDPTYAELSADLPALPQGWIAVADVDTFIAENPHLAVLDLEGFVEQFAPSEDGVSRLHLASDLSRFASAVTLEQSEIDGIPVDVITMFFGWSGLSEILQIEDPDFDIESNIAKLFAAQLEESEDLFSLLVALSPEDDVVGIATGYRVDLVDVEMNSISPDVAAGTLFNLVLDNFEVNNISAIGETFPAVEAPQTSG